MLSYRGATSVNRLIRHHVRFSTKSTPKSIAADKKIKDAKESILLSKPDCLPLLFEAIEEDPKNPNSYILLAIENLRKNDSSLCSQNIDCFDKISQIGTKGLITENEKLFGAAAYSWNKGNYFHAGALFESVLLSEPNDPLAIKLAQESYLNAGSGKNVLGVLLRHSLKASGQIAFGHIESGHITEGRDVAENTVNQKNGGKDLIALQALLNAQQLTGHSSEILSYLSNNEEHFEKTPAVLLLYANKGAAHIMRGNYHGAYRVIQQMIGECYKQYPETVIPNTHVTNIILLLWNVYIHINNDIVMYIVNMVVDLVVRNNTFNTSNNAMTDISLNMLLHLMHIIVYESDYYTEISEKNDKILAEKLANENNNNNASKGNNNNTVSSNNNSNNNNSNNDSSNGRTIVDEGVSLWTSIFGTKSAKPTKKSTNISDNSNNDINNNSNSGGSNSNSIDNKSSNDDSVKEPVSFGKLYRARDDDVEFILTAEHYEAIKSAFLNKIQLNNNDNNNNNSSRTDSISVSGVVSDSVRAAEIDDFFNQIKSKITVLGAPNTTNNANNSSINNNNSSNNSNNNTTINNTTTNRSDYEIMVENAVRPIQQIMTAATTNEYRLAAEVFNRNMENIERYCGGSATQRDLLVQSRIEILLRAGEWEMAKLLLRERTVRVPGDAQTWRKLGIVYRQLGEDKLAEHADYTAYTLGFGQGGYGGPI